MPSPLADIREFCALRKVALVAIKIIFVSYVSVPGSEQLAIYGLKCMVEVGLQLRLVLKWQNFLTVLQTHKSDDILTGHFA
jgi:hypothetical protein